MLTLISRRGTRIELFCCMFMKALAADPGFVDLGPPWGMLACTKVLVQT